MRGLRPSVLLIVCASLVSVSGQQVPVTITHGPMLGRVGTTDVRVWARTARPGSFRVRYGTTPLALDAWSDRATTSIEHDNTGSVLIKGLEPGTAYYYQVLTDEAWPVRPDGSFRTLPVAETFRSPELNPKGLFNFSFDFGTCSNQHPIGAGPWPPAYARMLEQLQGKVAFSIMNGDFIYEDKRDYPVEAWLDQVGLPAERTPRVVGLAPAIVGVWQNYKVYMERGDTLMAWHRNVPTLFTFDDHEILDNIDGTGTVGERDRKAVFRDTGVQAWYDYIGWANPIDPERIHFGRAQFTGGSDVLTDPDADFDRLPIRLNEPGALHVHWGGGAAAGVRGADLAKQPGAEGDPNAGVYEVVAKIDAHRLRIRPAPPRDGQATYSIGRTSYFDERVGNAHFFYLDTRGHRELSDPTHADRPELTMLGARQKAWLEERMRRSDADLFFIVSQVTFMIPHVGGTPNAGEVGDPNRVPTHDEARTGFVNERDELIRFWESLGKSVFVLSGDVHDSFVVKVTDRIWEFASGPHNSRNHRADALGNPPPNGMFDSAGRMCEIRWSTHFRPEVPTPLVRQPMFSIVQINNVFENRVEANTPRWVAFPHPQVVVQYFDGVTGRLMYAESVLVGR